MYAFFDIETNGLYYDVTKAHCMVITTRDSYGDRMTTRYAPEDMERGV